MSTCERCQRSQPSDSYDLFDYCAQCGKNLCGQCMAKGCCGSTPARSGMSEDFSEEEGGPQG